MTNGRGWKGYPVLKLQTKQVGVVIDENPAQRILTLQFGKEVEYASKEFLVNFAWWHDTHGWIRFGETWRSPNQPVGPVPEGKQAPKGAQNGKKTN